MPGLALLRYLRFESGDRLERWLVCVTLSAATVSLAVTVLLLGHAYVRPVAGALLFLPAVYLLFSKGTSAEAPTIVTSRTGPNAVDRAVVAAVLCFLAVYFVDAVTSPVSWWDGMASWGKWAADWGARTYSGDYVVGGYPQLVPRIVSVMYKLTGASAEVLPAETFAVHGLHVLFGVWYLAAVVRLAALLDMPAWPLVLAGFGSLHFREHTATGTVDVLVAALSANALAIYLGLARRSWRTRGYDFAVLGAALFAALYTKLTGIVTVVLVVAFHAARVGGTAVDRSHRPQISQTLRRGLAMAVLSLAPFIVEQAMGELRVNTLAQSPFEVNISVRSMPKLLASDAEVVYRGEKLTARPQLVQLRFWNNYDVPATLRLVFTIALVVWLAAAVPTPLGRATLPVIVGYGLIWFFWSWSDQRNIFVLMPALAATATLGATRLWSMAPAVVTQGGLALLVGTFIVLSGGAVLRDAQAHLKRLSGGPPALADRLPAIDGAVEQRIRLFFPQFAGDYDYLTAVSQASGAHHVFATSPIFRFFPKGAHALAVWPIQEIRDRDVFCGHEWHRPPTGDSWVLIADRGWHRIWLLDRRLADVSEPEIVRISDDAEKAGAESKTESATFGLDPEDFRERGYVMWEVSVSRSASETMPTPVFSVPDPSVIDRTVTSTALDDRLPAASLVRASGIVAIRPDAMSRIRRGEVKVGIRWPRDAPPPQIRSFKVSRHQRAGILPPQPPG